MNEPNKKPEDMSLAELRALAAERGMTAISSLRKGELLERLRAALAEEAPCEPSPRETTTGEATVREASSGDNSPAEKSSRETPYRENAPRESSYRESSRGYAPREKNSEFAPRENLRITRVRPQEDRSYNQNRSYNQDSRSYNQDSRSYNQDSRSYNQDSRSYNQNRSYDQEERSYSQDNRSYSQDNRSYSQDPSQPPKTLQELDSGEQAEGILEVLAEGYGFIRSDGYLSGEDDVYVAPSQIKRFNLKTGDWICGNRRIKGPGEKFSAVLFINSVNGIPASQRSRQTPFENLTPIFPKERLHLERTNGELSLRIVDLLSPVGKGQRGMIVAQPKVGKTTLLKQIAHALTENHPELKIIILLIDERPEEVTDMRESVEGPNVEVVYSTFDELPEHHKKVSEMVIERAKRLVESKKDVVILLDSITRLTRAYNITVTPSGRTLSGGLDPAALYMPKRFFGAARCMREGGSLTILSTALIETGSRLDDMVYEEFKGTGNMELVLNRKLSERRIFPAVDILKSSTRNDSLLLTQDEQDASAIIRKVTATSKAEEATEQILNLFASTKTNAEFMQKLKYIVF